MDTSFRTFRIGGAQVAPYRVLVRVELLVGMDGVHDVMSLFLGVFRYGWDTAGDEYL
jgi:hypothetical protein